MCRTRFRFARPEKLISDSPRPRPLLTPPSLLRLPSTMPHHIFRARVRMRMMGTNRMQIAIVLGIFINLASPLSCFFSLRQQLNVGSSMVGETLRHSLGNFYEYGCEARPEKKLTRLSRTVLCNRRSGSCACWDDHHPPLTTHHIRRDDRRPTTGSVICSLSASFSLSLSLHPGSYSDRWNAGFLRYRKGGGGVLHTS